MKLFGNTSRKAKPRHTAPARPPARSEISGLTETSEPLEPIITEAIPAPPPDRAGPRMAEGSARGRTISVSVLRSEELSEAARARRGRKRFRIGFLIYVCAFLILTLTGLVLLWHRMDVYERSRPQNAMAALFSAADGAYWQKLLTGLGMEGSYAASLDLDSAEYYKQMALYTDEKPAYSVRFGGKTFLDVTLKPGAELPFGAHEWKVGDFILRPSGLTVYVPVDAALTLSGDVVGADQRVEERALPVETGPFETGLSDAWLSKYVLDDIFTVENLKVTDAEGNDLPLTGAETNVWYCAPLTRRYTVTAPSYALITLNGVPVTEENAVLVQSVPIPDLDAAANYIAGPLPEVRTWTVDGLLRPPETEALGFGGVPLVPAERTDERCVYLPEHDPQFAAAHSDRILEVFDAYAAYNANRNRELEKNYDRYAACLVPGSDAADRAYRAKESVYWAAGRSAAVESVSLGEVIRYAEDCFTALVSFTLVTDETEDANSYLFVFVPYGGVWRVVSVLNK